MCQDKEHGGRRCEDNSASRRRRRKAKKSLERNKVVISSQGSIVQIEKAPLGMKEIKAEAENLGALLHAPLNPDEKEQAKQDAILEKHVTRLGLSIGLEAEKRAGFSLDEYQAGLSQLPEVTAKKQQELESLRIAYANQQKEYFDFRKAHLEPTDEESEEQDRLQDLNEKAEIRYNNLMHEISRINQMRLNHESTHAKALSNACKEVIAELRPVGGNIPEHEKSDSHAVNVFRKTVGTYYPSDWINRSAEVGDLVLSNGDGRAGYAHVWLYENSDKKVPIIATVVLKNKDLDNYVSKMSEDGDPVEITGTSFNFTGDSSRTVEHPIRVKFDTKKDDMGINGKPVGEGWRYGYVPEPNKANSFPTEKSWYRHKTKPGEHTPTIFLSGNAFTANDADAYHEFCHRVESTAPNDAVRRMEEAFLTRRTTDADGKQEELSRIYENDTDNSLWGMEVGRRDGFMDHYIGKQYLASYDREVLSVGSEGIFAGRYGAFVGLSPDTKADLDHRGFTLGIFAAA